MLVYHGSGETVEFPAVRKTKYTKDFSWGFYCTNNRSQAEKWAKRKDDPTVNVYEYTPNSELRVLTFDSVCDEWLDFIVDCRCGKLHDYDIVEGPMADDQVWDYVQDYLAERIDREQFMTLVKFRHPTHQISFHTLQALGCLLFKEAIKL